MSVNCQWVDSITSRPVNSKLYQDHTCPAKFKGQWEITEAIVHIHKLHWGSKEKKIKSSVSNYRTGICKFKGDWLKNMVHSKFYWLKDKPIYWRLQLLWKHTFQANTLNHMLPYTTAYRISILSSGKRPAKAYLFEVNISSEKVNLPQALVTFFHLLTHPQVVLFDVHSPLPLILLNLFFRESVISEQSLQNRGNRLVSLKKTARIHHFQETAAGLNDKRSLSAWGSPWEYINDFLISFSL